MYSFTVIMDYKGGTYISQVKSRGVKSALKKWAKELDYSEIYGLSKNGKIKLITEVADEIPVGLKGLNSIWCIHCSLPGGSALINAVKTYEEYST